MITVDTAERKRKNISMQFRFIPSGLNAAKSSEPTLETLLEKVQKQTTRAQRAIIRKAYHLAEDAHKFQKRLSGEPYITHPLAVALLLADMEMDHEVICAALLHDVLEDTSISRDYLLREFGETITQLVDGVTKISVIKSQGAENRQATNIRKIILATIKDARVLIIKLADKLHNMRTLNFQPPHKAKRIAQEVLEIYAPLAGRMGIYKIKAELEDLALYYVDREAYQQIKNGIAEKKVYRDERVKAVIAILNDKMKENKIKARIEGRSKHFYSIYKKIKEQNKNLESIYDLTGVRILVETIPDCYAALGIIHTLWNPVPGRFKDYISVPKSNGYQSLHTTVVGPDGKFLEVQIRTLKMHQISEFGIAAHWAYKEKEQPILSMQEQFKLLQNIAITQEEGGDVADFMEELKTNLSIEDEVYVFSPKGEIFSLPAGSTVLDFAFRIHTELGLKCAGAKIGDRLISIRTPLKSGQQVTIITNPNVKPSLNWLTFLKTAHARSKLRAYFRRHELLEKENKTEAQRTEEALREREEVREEIKERVAFKAKSSPEEYAKLIEFAGESNVPVKIAMCCTPKPGDAVLGFITRGYGLSVHKKGCPSLKLLSQQKENEGRIVKVRWRGYDTAMSVVILIEGEDRPQIYLDLVYCLAQAGANIVEAQAQTAPDGKISDSFHIEIDSEAHLQNILQALLQIRGVSKAVVLEKKVTS